MMMCEGSRRTRPSSRRPLPEARIIRICLRRRSHENWTPRRCMKDSRSRYSGGCRSLEAAVRPIEEARWLREPGSVAVARAGYARDSRGGPRLWNGVARPNLMIKVPATEEGIPAIRQLISEGINVNVTLLFSQDMYEAVAEAYIGGLEKCAAGKATEPSRAWRVSLSAASTRRWTGSITRLKTERGQSGSRARIMTEKRRSPMRSSTYQRYRTFPRPRWEALQERGAQTQRVLWASTGPRIPNTAT